MFLLAYHTKNCEPLESPHSVDFLKTDESLLKLFGRNVFEVLLTLFLTLTRVSVKHNFFLSHATTAYDRPTTLFTIVVYVRKNVVAF